ncbi:hypothetical protein FALBO_8376 [Fusarium albosuccineum]|uniref:Uncharacterized protein n=1 Tax=Fusarium albosuccineum TaxID=1237068 RepID=A0A8H4L9Q8_9HYPO|nr:hypothetical protein FALBO_8376 [Fusarium albosuccineum]
MHLVPVAHFLLHDSYISSTPASNFGQEEHTNRAMEEFLGECLGPCLCRTTASIYLYLVDVYIIQPRRHVIIQRGRRLQAALGLPECLCSFAQQDPGMAGDDMRTAAGLLGVSWLLSAAVGLWVVMPSSTGTLLDPLVLGLGIVNPICMVCLVWLHLILSKRSRVSYLRRTGQALPERRLDAAIGDFWEGP